MNKEELIKAIADETKLGSGESKVFLAAFINVIQSALASGESVQITGFASFSVKQRSERKGRNIQTKKEIVIPARNVVKFSTGKQLKEAVNSNKATPTKKGKK